jgi:hypothetical protein
MEKVAKWGTLETKTKQLHLIDISHYSLRQARHAQVKKTRQARQVKKTRQARQARQVKKTRQARQGKKREDK